MYINYSPLDNVSSISDITIGSSAVFENLDDRMIAILSLFLPI